MQNIMVIDLETFSEIDLVKSGIYKYAEDSSFEILLFAYKLNDNPTICIDLTKEEPPNNIIQMLHDPKVKKVAHNANFERVCLGKKYGCMEPSQWCDTMIMSLELGLPAALNDVGTVLKLNVQKDTKGKALINYFCKLCKATKVNGMRMRNLPEHSVEKWELFKEYCTRDVDTEFELYNRLIKQPMPESEKKLWNLDQKINDNGVRLEMNLVKNAIKLSDQISEILMDETRKITGLENPNSTQQLKKWLELQGVGCESLNKASVEKILSETEIEEVIQVLEMRQMAAKSSIKKYEAMHNCANADNRARGLFQFYGASRTGRWCLTGDHEVLTKDGWRRLDEWSGGFIACWNTNESISFQKAKALDFNYTGEMIQINSQRCDQVSTPDHKMPYWNKKNGFWDSTEIKNLIKRHGIPFHGQRFLTTSPLNHDALRVLIMTQADGYFTNDRELRFRFKKSRKVERCKTLLRRANIIYSMHPNKCDGTISFSVGVKHLPLYLKMFADKTFGMWLLDESPEVIFDELEHWDAYRCGPNSIQYSTTNKQNADIIQALAHLSGRAGTIVKKHENHDIWNTCYCVNIWLTPGHDAQIRKEDINTCAYSGKVYCAETPTGYFLVRRNGKVWVTGNSGRRLQLQNLPQNHLKDLDSARNLLISGDFEKMREIYDNIPKVLSELIRTAIIPSENHKFLVSDFSAIEARVLSWLAGEEWRLEVFRTHGKIYEASASAMFKVPFEEIGKESPLRQKGKIAELALGFAGSVGALVRMGALEKGLTEPELKPLVDAWRKANPKIVKFWYDMGNAAKKCIQTKRPVNVKLGIRFTYENGIMFMRLPSGRRLAYVRPVIKQDPKTGHDEIWIHTQEAKSWVLSKIWHGTIVENLIQGTARDILAEAMMRIDKAGLTIVGSVHDEVICEASLESDWTIEKLNDIMKIVPEWADGLPLDAAGFECMYYQK